MQREVREGPVDVARTTARLSDSVHHRPDTLDEVIDAVYGQMTALCDMEGNTIADALAFLAMSRYGMSLCDGFRASMPEDSELMKNVAYRFSQMASDTLERLSGQTASDLIGGTQAEALN